MTDAPGPRSHGSDPPTVQVVDPETATIGRGVMTVSPGPGLIASVALTMRRVSPKPSTFVTWKMQLLMPSASVALQMPNPEQEFASAQSELSLQLFFGDTQPFPMRPP